MEGHTGTRVYLRLLRYARPYWAIALAASGCLGVSGFLSAYPILLLKKAVDVAVGDAAGNARTFYVLALQYLALRAILGGVQLAESYLSTKLVQNVVLDLRGDLYAHLQSLPVSFYETKGSGDIMSRALRDVGAMAGGLVGPLTRLAGELTQLGWALFFLLRIDPRLTLLSLVVAPPLGYAVHRFGIQARNLAWQLGGAHSAFWSFLAQNIAGMREIKIFGREQHELQRFQANARAIDRLGLEDAILNATLTFLTGLLFSLGEMVILLFGGLSTYRGALTLGNLAAFLMYLRMLYNPVITLGRRYDQSQRTLVSAARVLDLFDVEPEPGDCPGAQEVAIHGEVRFEDVSFRYRPEQEVLHHVSFVAAAGETIALVGPSGGGKTTISKLIPRLYDPDEGRVLVDGQDARDLPLCALRAQIAVVFQEPFLFNATIRENIAYGRLEATGQEIVAAAEAANAHPFVVGLPEGYETIVGERGVKLSGGQRQRIAIARALLKDPRILILDEATSAVDAESERLIQEALERLRRGRTSLVIAHRLSTILHADKILVIEGGQVVESGTHADLLASGGTYSKLYTTSIPGRLPVERPMPRAFEV
jgi:subfamily B ATP-binding cassette protein MsbA